MVGYSVIGCKNRPQHEENLQFHRIPVKNIPLAVKWNGLCDQANPTDLDIAKNRRICDAHFRDEDYVMKGTLEESFVCTQMQRLKVQHHLK